jgi:hypothetical protein
MDLRNIKFAFGVMRKGLAHGFHFCGFSPSKTRETACSFLHFAVATAILIFYSRNIVSAAIWRLLAAWF